MNRQKIKFSWDLLGDIALGPPPILVQIPRLEVYRLNAVYFQRRLLNSTLELKKQIGSFYESR